MRIPKDSCWLFWDVDLEVLDLERDTTYILARVLEHGRLHDVKWAIETFGLERIRDFFRDVGHPGISERTLCFWKAFFNTDGQTWQRPAPFRKDSSAPWES